MLADMLGSASEDIGSSNLFDGGREESGRWIHFGSRRGVRLGAGLHYGGMDGGMDGSEFLLDKIISLRLVTLGVRLKVLADNRISGHGVLCNHRVMDIEQTVAPTFTPPYVQPPFQKMNKSDESKEAFVPSYNLPCTSPSRSARSIPRMNFRGGPALNS